MYQDCFRESPHEGQAAEKNPTPSAPILDGPHVAAQRNNLAWRILVHSGLLVVLAFLLLMIGYAPLFAPWDFDYDEGLNMMKALLHLRGYELYTEIWSDQPPLMTVLLVGWMRLFGESVLAARLLLLGLSAGLVWAFFQVTRLGTGTIAALGATFLLVVSEEYIRLSPSIMIGLPSLAFAMIAFYLLVWSEQRARRMAWLASALLMGIALQSKFMTVITVPAALVYLLWGERGAQLNWRARLARTTIWSALMGVSFLAVGLYYGSLNIEMLLLSHLGTETRSAFLDAQNIDYLSAVARNHIVYLVLGLLGLVGAVGTRRFRGLLIPLTWFITAVAALLYHKPLWHHHVTLITIPLTWLAAYGIGTIVEALHAADVRNTATEHRLLRGMAISILLATLLGIFVFYPSPLSARIHEQTYRSLPNYNATVVAQLKQDVETNPGWIFTDRPYYAFQAGATVPPPIAVLSRKRLESGQINEEALLQVIDTYHPPYVILERFVPLYSATFMERIDQEYNLVLAENQTFYYSIW